MEFFDGINHPSAATVIADGLSGGMLYAGMPADSLGKDFTAAQYADYKAHGLFIALVYESVAGDFLGGTAAGTAHAQALWNDCAAKGVAVSHPACSTVDEHVAAGELPTVVAYQHAFRDELRALGWTGPIGIYGFPETTTACHDAGVADWFWGAGTRSAQPAYLNVWQDNTGTIQVGGSADDRDWVLVPLPTGGMVSDFTSPGNPLTPDGKNWSTLFGGAISYGAELDDIFEAILLGSQAGPTWPAGPGMLQRLADLQTAVAGIPAAVAAAVQSEITAEQTALLAAIKTLPAPLVQQITADPTAVAQQLIAAGLPGDLVGALLAVLQKAAAPAPAA